jgi:hypothetical protein
VVPYTLDTNDMRFARAQGFPRAMIFTYLRCIAVSTYCMQKQTSGWPCWLRRHLPHPGPARPDAGAATPTISEQHHEPCLGEAAHENAIKTPTTFLSR